jgi:hypothetical protein
LPIVQTGTTVKASIANVQAAPVSAGTANAIQFLNASKAPTTSSNLLFDGAVVAVGGTSSAWSGVGNVVQLTGTALWGSGAVGHVSLNTFFDGANYKYLTTDFVTDYYQFGGSHVFRFAPSGTAGTNVAFTTAFSTTSAGNIAFPNGQGIDFSATPGTGTSELLADYEEGTWTPSITGSTSNSGQAYTLQEGRYTKIGRQVNVQFYIALSTEGTFTGSFLQLSGLPFTIAATPLAVSGGMLQFGGMAANYITIGLQLNQGSTFAFLTGMTAAAAGTGYVGINDLTDTSSLTGQFTYFV